MVIKQLLSIVVLFLKNPDDFNLLNPLAFNVAAFMDPLTSSKFLYTLADVRSVRDIWTIVLTAIGLSAAAGKKRLSFGGGLIATATGFLACSQSAWPRCSGRFVPRGRRSRTPRDDTGGPGVHFLPPRLPNRTEFSILANSFRSSPGFRRI